LIFAVWVVAGDVLERSVATSASPFASRDLLPSDSSDKESFEWEVFSIDGDPSGGADTVVHVVPSSSLDAVLDRASNR
jgi:hypothetical protein